MKAQKEGSSLEGGAVGDSRLRGLIPPAFSFFSWFSPWDNPLFPYAKGSLLAGYSYFFIGRPFLLHNCRVAFVVKKVPRAYARGTCFLGEDREGIQQGRGRFSERNLIHHHERVPSKQSWAFPSRVGPPSPQAGKVGLLRKRTKTFYIFSPQFRLCTIEIIFQLPKGVSCLPHIVGKVALGLPSDG